MYLCQLAIPSPGVSATNNGQPQWHFHSRGRSYIVWALKGLVRARWDFLLRGGLHARATAHQLANDSRHAVRAWFAARQPARLLLVRLQQLTPSYTFLYPDRPNPSDDTTFQFSSFNICALYEYLLRLYLFYIMNVGSYVSSYIGTLRRSVLSQCFGRDFKYLLVCVDELTRSPIASVQIFSEVRQRALKSRAVRVDQMQWENVAPCISTH